MVSGSILFPINQQVDIIKLQNELLSEMKYQKAWEHAEKKGFCGLDYDIIEVEGVRYQRIIVVWCFDGVNGVGRDDLSTQVISRIQRVIERHTP